jgi:hypothetical protein
MSIRQELREAIGILHSRRLHAAVKWCVRVLRKPWRGAPLQPASCLVGAALHVLCVCVYCTRASELLVGLTDDVGASRVGVAVFV